MLRTALQCHQCPKLRAFEVQAYTMARGLLLVALLAVASVHLAAGQDTKNTLQGLQGQCVTDYNNIISTYYANNTACSAVITLALNTTVKANCPPTGRGSQVQQCMRNNGTAVMQQTIDAWTNWVRGCEIMYIAARTGSSESEEGLQAADNSCFQLFSSLSDFQSWLNAAGPGNSASATRFAAGTLVAGIVSAVMLVAAAMW